MEYDRSAARAGQPAPISRAEAIERERERRNAQRSRRDATSTDAAIDGFTVRKWRKAGVFGISAAEQALDILRRLAEQADPAAPEWAVETIRNALNGEPGDALPHAVRLVLMTAEPELVASTLTCVHAAGFTWLSDDGRARLAFLLNSDPVPSPAVRAALPDEQDPDGAFALYLALSREQISDFSAQNIYRLLSWVPLGIVDDLIDAQIVGPTDEPWRLRSDDTESSYLKARLTPQQVTTNEAQEIQWSAKLQRDAFIAGVDSQPPSGGVYDLLLKASRGENSILKDLELALPPEQALRLRQVRNSIATETWSEDILGDRGLWSVIVALWEPKATVNPARSDLHALVALRRAYELICSGDHERAGYQVNKLESFNPADRHYRAEALNFRAYLLLLEEKLDDAAKVLGQIRELHPIATANLALIERRSKVRRNDRGPASNPFLDLGLPHGAPNWKMCYRDQRREHARDVEKSARLNRAMKSIEDATKKDDWSDFFVLPLNVDYFRPPADLPVSLIPPLAPLARRTTPSAAVDLAAVRRRAIASLLPALLDAPSRPDHHYGTTA